MDILDVYEGRFYQLFPANYYERMPVVVSSATDRNNLVTPMPFDYEIVDALDRSYTALLGNLISNDGANETIKTKTDCGFKPSGYVTHDGELFIISSVTVDRRASVTEASKLFGTPVGTEWILRLTKVDNPWGIDT